MVALTIFLYFLGKRTEKKKAEQDAQAEAMAQTVSMLIIDKKRMKMKESGLPQAAIDQAPWYSKNARLPIVKAKIGPRIMTLISEPEIFDQIPVKKEIKARVSGLYIISFRGLHGKVQAPPQKKGIRGWFSRMQKRASGK